MVSVWIALAFAIGGFMGVLVMALMAMASDEALTAPDVSDVQP